MSNVNNFHKEREARLQKIADNQQPAVANIKRQILDIEARGNQTLWSDKVDQIKEGKEAMRNQLKDKYKESALNEELNYFESEQKAKARHELQAYDEETQSRIHELANNVKQKAIQIEQQAEPQTQVEFDQYKFYVQKIRFKVDNMFQDNTMRIDKLDPLFDRAEYDDAFAKALVQAREIPYNAIANNELLDKNDKATLKARLDDKFNELENKVMPTGFKFLKEAQKELDYFQHTSGSQLSMFNLTMERL